MSMTRREWFGGVLAAGCCGLAGRAVGKTADGAGGRTVADWYKGMLHSHTFWSDGCAFPEQAVAWYKSRGYHFYSMTDHNVFAADPDHWLPVSGPAYPTLNPMHINYQHRFPEKGIVDAYRRDFPKYEERTGRDGTVSEIRLKTYVECARLFDEPGRFLLIPGCEASHAVASPDGTSSEVHCNYLGVQDLLPQHRLRNWGWTERKLSVGAFVERLRVQTEEKAKELGTRGLYMLNHPIWGWYDVPPEALVEAWKVRFFEVCNNGGNEPPASMPQDGFDTDRFWDVVNAFRARRGQPLLYGVGTDDTHWYDEKIATPGDSWIRVRAPELTQEALFAAMERGDFVACAGVEPETVEFDRTKGRLSVSVAGKAGVVRRVRFIVTKRDFSEKPVRAFDIAPQEEGGEVMTRHIKVYDEKVGQMAKTVEGKIGEAVAASYELKADDLYVRARVESDEKARCQAALHPKIRVAWTQPYQA